MHSRTTFRPRPVLIVAIASLLFSSVACGHASQPVAPSALASNPAGYDGQDVTVTGTAKNPTTRLMRRGTDTIYQLCDNACINVVQFGDTNVAEGGQVTVSGRFHTSFGRRMTMSNVLVVGGRMGAGPPSSSQ
jgi:formylmethanofuran dehydrogenase subunit C